MSQTIETKRNYRIPEVARALRVTPQTVRAYVKQGKLRNEGTGKTIFITEYSLREYLKLK